MRRFLFNGNNEDHLKGTFVAYKDPPDNWTSCPLDALVHSYKSARKFNSKMAALCYTGGPDRHFTKVELPLGRACCEPEWYDMSTPFLERDTRRVRLYNFNDLREFVKLYFDERHLESLKAMNCYNLICGEEPRKDPLELKLA